MTEKNTLKIKSKKLTTSKIYTVRAAAKESTRGILTAQTETQILLPFVKNALSKENTYVAWMKKSVHFGRAIKSGTVKHVKISYLKEIATHLL